MQNSKINFTSRIRLVHASTFFEKTKKLPFKNFVGNPYGEKQVITAKNAFTSQITLCSANGITEKNQVTLAHITPFNEKHLDENYPEKLFGKKIDFNAEELGGLLIGNESYNNKSNILFENFKNFLDNKKINYSMFKGQHQPNKTLTSIAYFSDLKEWLISNTFISQMIEKKVQNAEKIALATFDEVLLSNKDFLTL